MHQNVTNFLADVVHLRLTDPLFFADTKISENAHRSPVYWLIAHTGDNMKMDVGMLWMFSKLNHICFGTANYFCKAMET